MWRIALRDLQWRRRRLLISTLGTALVFTMALVLAGLNGSFGAEASNATKAIGADAWFVHIGTAGPITGGLPVSEAAVGQVARLPGVTQAAGFIYGNQTVGAGASATDANLFGVEPGMVGTPVPDTGRQPAGNSEAMVDDALPYAIGQRFVVGSDTFTVVGLLHRSTLLSGTPNVFITLAAAQQLMFGGRPLVTAVVSRGVPSGRPANLQVLTPAQVTANMKVPLAKAAQVVGFIEIFLWLIAACIIGSVIYVSALEKTRDFAVLKATGASDGQLMVTLGLQAVIISVAAAVVAVILAVLLAPVFPIVVVIPVWAVLLLPLLAVVLGLMASTAGLRRAVGVEPALAFGGP